MLYKQKVLAFVSGSPQEAIGFGQTKEKAIATAKRIFKLGDEVEIDTISSCTDMVFMKACDSISDTFDDSKSYTFYRLPDGTACTRYEYLRSRENTDDDITLSQLEAVGGNFWSKAGKARVYFNVVGGQYGDKFFYDFDEERFMGSFIQRGGNLLERNTEIILKKIKK